MLWFPQCPEEASEYITKVKEIQVVDSEVCSVLHDVTVCGLSLENEHQTEN